VGVAAGDEHSAALLSDGSVVCWGDNSGGQGDVPPGVNGVALAAGPLQTAVIEDDVSPGEPRLLVPRFILAAEKREFRLQLLAKNHGKKFATEGLPPGLRLLPLTGEISGRPTSCGVYDVTLMVSNELATDVRQVTFYILGGYSEWTRANHLLGMAGDYQADTDHDGLDQLTEYAFGQDPNQPNRSGLPWSESVETAEGCRPAISFYRVPSRCEVLYEVQVSHDLRYWRTLAESNHGAEAIAAKDGVLVEEVVVGLDRVTVRVIDHVPCFGEPQRYFRVRLSAP
jgi:hypothetical protein